jgi:hypothetical protein
MKRFPACLLAVVLIPMISACSGGGGGGSSGTSGNTSGNGSSTGEGSSGSSSGSGSPQPSENLASISTPAEPWTIPATTLTATDNDGNTYDLSVSNVVPSGTVTYNGQTADKVVLGLGLSENGGVVQTVDTTVFYATNPFDPLGLAGSVDGVPYTADVTSFTPFPATLTVGSSGPVLSATYKDPGGDVIGTVTETYTVTADSPTALYVSIDTSGSFNGSPLSDTITYALSDSGSRTPTLANVQLSYNGTTLTFQ